MPKVTLTLGHLYGEFVKNLRNTWVQELDSTNEIIVTYKENEFLFRNSDLYLVGLRKPKEGAAWRRMGDDENYNKMKGADDKISSHSIEKALNLDFSGYFDLWSAALRQVVLVTAEAAKSYPVEYLVKRIIAGEIEVKWNDLKPLLTRWSKTREFIGGSVTGPLTTLNYVDAGLGEGDIEKLKAYLPDLQ